MGPQKNDTPIKPEECLPFSLTRNPKKLSAIEDSPSGGPLFGFMAGGIKALEDPG